MPKVVDHQQRRDELAEAVWAVIRREGAAGASVRAVAAEAGWSHALLRTFFASHTDLLRHALDSMVERVSGRIARQLAVCPPGEQRARAVLAELLPLDDARRAEAEVWARLATDGVSRGWASSIADLGWVGTRRTTRIVVCDLNGRRVGDNLDAALPTRLEAAAERLHLMIDALTLQVVLTPDRATSEYVHRVADVLLVDAAGLAR